MTKIVFYLMNEKGYTVLKNFLEKYNSENIDYVVLSRDKNIQNDYYNEIVSLCKKYNIKYYDRKDVYPYTKGYKFAIGWRWIIDDTHNLIVLHDSLLPKYRGFAPLVNMLINGEKRIGVTALFASNEYDKGEIVGKEAISIDYPIKIQQAIELISPLYSKLVNNICEKILNGDTIKGVKQDEREATYSLWRDELDYFINWNENSGKIRRMIDALGYPYKGAMTYLNGEKIIIDDAIEYDDVKIENRDVGKVIFVENGYPIVVCKKGLLKITKARDLTGQSILPLKKFRSRFGGIIDDTI
jgi:methionyl-tRNA formyltransferase